MVWAWLKKNLVTILLVVLAVLALVVVVFGGIIGFGRLKTGRLLSLVQSLQAKNELSYLEVKRAKVVTKKELKKDEVKNLEDEIKEVKKKAEKAKLEVKGLSNDEVANRLTELGF